MKNLLITGSTGFIGKKLVKKLVKNYNVWCLVRSYQNSKNKNVRYIEHNLSYDIPIINLPNNIDTVIHLISSDKYRSFPNYAYETFKVNTSSTAFLLDWSHKIGVKNFIFASTGGLYGNYNKPIKEDFPFKYKLDEKISYYFCNKEISEKLCKIYDKILNITILRIFYPYGPEQDANFLIPRIIKKIKEKELIKIQGKQGMSFNPIYIDDAIDLLNEIISSEIKGTFNISGSYKTNLLEIITIISKHLKIKPKIEITAESSPNMIADISNTAKILKKRFVNIEKGIFKTLKLKKNNENKL